MKKTIAAVAVLVALGLFGWSLVAPVEEVEEPQESAPIESVQLDQSEIVAPPSDTAQVVARVLPSVVNVRTTSVEFDPFGGDTESQGQGSGVVIDADGIIITNFHVISGASDVQIKLQDGRELDGEVIGGAPEKDLAVVRVEADDLVPIELGKSANLRLGDDVVAVGFPLGLGGATVTKGIISAKGRTITPQGASVALTDMIQTDAAINPGNSGGALVDMNGRLVGINSAAASAAAAENIGFAISIDEALPAVREILGEPEEERAWIGIDIRVPLTPEVAAELGLDVDSGVLISGTFEGSPAEAAGIQQGDVITAIEGNQIEDNADLAETLADLDPGDQIEITLVGASGERTVTVELEQRPVEFGVPEEP